MKVSKYHPRFNMTFVKENDIFFKTLQILAVSLSCIKTLLIACTFSFIYPLEYLCKSIISKMAKRHIINIISDCFIYLNNLVIAKLCVENTSILKCFTQKSTFENKQKITICCLVIFYVLSFSLLTAPKTY